MRRNLEQEKAITLISLVITIIVLLILAGITIATLTGDNGIITKALEAREKTEMAAIEEQLRLAQLSLKIKAETESGKITIEDLVKELENQGVDDVTVKDGSLIIGVTGGTGGQYIYDIEETGDGTGKEDGEIKLTPAGPIDRPKPSVSIKITEKTDKDIKVQVTTKRNSEGRLEYYIKEENGKYSETPDGTEIEPEYSGTRTSDGYTFTTDPTKTYTHIKVIAKAKNGEKTTKEIEIPNIPELSEVNKNIALSYKVNGGKNWDGNWTAGPLTVTVSTTETGYTLQTSQNGTTWKNGEEIASTQTNSSGRTKSSQTFKANGTLYARLKDDKNGKTGKIYTKDINKIDTTGPEISNVQVTQVTTNSITITADISDSQSGVEKCFYSKDDGTTWEPTEGQVVAGSTKSYTIGGLTHNQTYSLKIKAVDRVENKTIQDVDPTQTGEVPGGTGNIGMDYKKPKPGDPSIEIVYDTTTWTNSSVKVTLKDKIENSPYTLQYKKNNQGEWTDYTEPIILDDHADYIVARLVDSAGNYGATATGSAMNIDKIAPTIEKSLSAEAGTNEKGETILNLDLEAKDVTSGIQKVEFYYNKTATDSASQTTTESTDPHIDVNYETKKVNNVTTGPTTIQKVSGELDDLTGDVTYSIYAKVYDVAGNCTSTETTPITKETYTVSYDANGGTGAPASQIKVKGFDLALSKNIPTYEGCSFLGWAIKEDLTTVKYDTTIATPVSYSEDKTVTLYAIWDKYYLFRSGFGLNSLHAGDMLTNGNLHGATMWNSNAAYTGWSNSSNATYGYHTQNKIPMGNFKELVIDYGFGASGNPAMWDVCMSAYLDRDLTGTDRFLVKQDPSPSSCASNNCISGPETRSVRYNVSGLSGDYYFEMHVHNTDNFIAEVSGFRLENIYLTYK